MSSVLYTKEFELGDKVGSHMLSPTSYDAPVKSQCVSCRYIWWRWVICLSCCVQVFHNGIKVVFGNNRSHLTISRVKDINLWIAVALLVSVCEASKPSIIQLCFAEWLDTRVTNWGSLDMKLNDPLSFWKFGFCETWSQLTYLWCCNDAYPCACGAFLVLVTHGYGCGYGHGSNHCYAFEWQRLRLRIWLRLRLRLQLQQRWQFQLTN